MTSNNTTNVETPVVATEIKNVITIINLEHESNKPLVEKLRGKLGKIIDNMPLFAYQNGVEHQQYKVHEKQNRLFMEYPRFNLMTTPTAIYLYLKREGEGFPSVCWKIKKSDVKTVLTVKEINEYINQTVDYKNMLESTLTNETIVVIDNLKVTVLIKTLEKQREQSKTTSDPITYSKLYDLIRSKFDEVLDSGYLDLLNKVCVMMWETWSNPTNVNFEAKEIKKEVKSVVKKEQKPKVDAKKEPAKVKEQAVKEEATKKEVTEVEHPKVVTPKTIPGFSAPANVPNLENVNVQEEATREIPTVNQAVADKAITESK